MNIRRSHEVTGLSASKRYRRRRWDYMTEREWIWHRDYPGAGQFAGAAMAGPGNSAPFPARLYYAISVNHARPH
jgi:hypothetical protein